MPPINSITLVLCYAPAILAMIAILTPILQAIDKAQREQDKERRAEEWHRQRIRNSETLATNREALRPLQVGKWSDDIVKKDLEIENLKLKNALLEKELGKSQRWTPYDDESTTPK